MDISPPWFALQTRPRNEKKIDYLLAQKGYQCLTPTYKQKRKWSDRTVEIELPLFPTYVFCRLGTSALGKIVSTQGVVRIVGFGGEPAEVPREEIEALQLLTQSNVLREPWQYLPQGTPVLIETGPLAGLQGVICPSEKKKRLVISVTLLQQSVAVELDEGTKISVVAGAGGERFSLESEMAVRLLRKA